METLRKKFTHCAPVGGKVNVFRCKRDEQVFTVKLISVSNEEDKKSLVSKVSSHKALNHVNVASLMDVMVNGLDVFLVYEYSDTNLRDYQTSMQIDNQSMKRFLYQILNGVAYLHSRGILHRALIPENVMVSIKTSILMKVIAFNEARNFDVLVRSSDCRNIEFASYRAPELLFGPNYSTASDVWAVGCIFAEMYLRRPLFDGPDLMLLEKMFTLLGTPTKEIWPGKTSFRGSIAELDLNPPKQPKELSAEFPELEPAGADILSKMLCLYPENRISAADAVKHPYFEGI